MDIGKKCVICGTVDFLPIFCKYCEKYYCKEHATLEHPLHKCSRNEKVYEEKENASYKNVKKCIICNKGLFTTTCNDCNQVVCMSHRFPDEHKCDKYIKEDKNVARYKNSKNLKCIIT